MVERRQKIFRPTISIIIIIDCEEGGVRKNASGCVIVEKAWLLTSDNVLQKQGGLHKGTTTPSQVLFSLLVVQKKLDTKSQHEKVMKMTNDFVG